MINLIFLILGIVGLLIGTELIIRGALNIAEHFKISQLFIGLTILAVGTDLPELAVDITGAVHRLQGIETSGLVIGETIGTCFGQIALTLGILGLITTLTLTKRELIRDGLMMVGSVLILFLAGFDGTITRIEGIIFMIIYGFYFLVLVREEKMYREEVERAPTLYKFWAILSLISGFVVLIFCSNLIVTNATKLAEAWGIAQSFIGIIILGLGTSLPEIAVSIGALRKKAYRLSVGNLIGSNIFDVLFTLGIGSAISGFLVKKSLLKFDIPILFVVSLIVILLFRRKMKLERKEAIILIAMYGIYIGLKFYGL